MALRIKESLNILTVITVLFFAAAAHAQGINSCDPYGDVPVNVTPVFEDPKVNLETSINGIQKMIHEGEHNINESIAMGVTHYEPTLEFHLPVKTVTFGDGTSCVHVERANVTIGYKDVTVYVAKEIPRDSCGFKQIMDHEKKHIEVNRQILAEYTPALQKKLSDYLKLNGTFREENASYSAALVREKLQSILNELSGEMIKENRTRQQAVDSPAEYKRITTSCNGQLAAIAGRAQGKYR